jgi:hypothetical protein
MAENTNTSGWGKEMNAAEHIGTYSAFITGTKIASGLIAVLLVLMAAFLL